MEGHQNGNAVSILGGGPFGLMSIEPSQRGIRSLVVDAKPRNFLPSTLLEEV